MNPSSIGTHTLHVEVIEVKDAHVQLAQHYVNVGWGDDDPKDPNSFSNLLDNKWNVFKLTDVEYQETATPYLSDIKEYAPQRLSREKSKMTDVDWDNPHIKKLTIDRYAHSIDRSEEGGSVGKISVSSRIFNSSIRRQIKRLKRYVNG